ncbi:MAG: hypothetical protein H6R10_3793 [Rhodocyclaceae bacterium]|nr:hypothetical protein [Rhodocyclaceae bacterium]
MEKILRKATERTPYTAFDPDAHRLVLQGESYPEDAAAFFGPLQQALRDYVAGLGDAPFVVDLELNYFNSSSAKALMNMFMLLEQAAAAGRDIRINWRYHPDDDTMEEFGQDFAEDFHHATFTLCPSLDD